MGVRRSRLDVIDLNRVVRAAFMPAGLAPSIVLLEHPVPQFEPIPGLEKVIIIHARVDSMTSLTLSSVSGRRMTRTRSEEHTSELQSRFDLVCRLLLEHKNTK